jgi:5'-nucleotidase
LARRATFIDSLRFQDVPYVLVDGGDFIQRDRKRYEPETLATWKDMHQRNYHAVTLGELELSQWELTQTLMTEYPLPIVCSNVEQLRDGEWAPVGVPSRVVDINGIRVGFLSVIGEGQLTRAMLEKAEGQLRLLAPMETTVQIATELRQQADIVVLLAHLDPRAMEQYASTLTDVDVVVGGHVTRKDEGPRLIGDAIVNRSGTRGQHMGITRLIISPNNEIVDFGGLNFTLVPAYPEDAEVKADVDRIMEEANQWRRDQAKESREKRMEEIDANKQAAPDPETPQAHE